MTKTAVNLNLDAHNKLYKCSHFGSLKSIEKQKYDLDDYPHKTFDFSRFTSPYLKRPKVVFG